MITEAMQKKLANMTSTEQMECLSVLCSEHHMKYGDLVGKYGHLIPPPLKRREDNAPELKCRKCGKMFTPRRLADGHWSKRHTCEECYKIAQEEREAKALRPKKRKQQVRQEVCDRCGNNFETTSYRRRGIPSYCPECREIKRKERWTTYNKKRGQLHLQRG